MRGPALPAPALRGAQAAVSGQLVRSGALTFQTLQPIFHLMSNSSAAPVSAHHDPSSGDGPVPPPVIAAARDRFSSLRDGFVYFDAPGGTQTPDEVGAAVADVYLRASGNLGAHYATGQRLEKLVEEARAA